MTWDKHRDPAQLRMTAVPIWLLEGAVLCALQVSRTTVRSDGQDMLCQVATEILERAPADVDDLTAQYDCTGEYSDCTDTSDNDPECESCGATTLCPKCGGSQTSVKGDQS